MRSAIGASPTCAIHPAARSSFVRTARAYAGFATSSRGAGDQAFHISPREALLLVARFARDPRYPGCDGCADRWTPHRSHVSVPDPMAGEQRGELSDHLARIVGHHDPVAVTRDAGMVENG